MLKIGLIQLKVIEGDISKNTEHLEKMIQEFKTDDVDVLCFPELCISGYQFERADVIDEQRFMAKMAKKYKIAIIGGVHAVRTGLHYDTACLWDDTGELLGEYKKIHLWSSENDFFESGTNLVVVPYKGWDIGLLLCADLGFPEISGPMATKMNADILIYLSAWAAGYEDLFVTCTKARAAENQIYVLSLNRATGNEQYCGNSLAAGPDGSVIGHLPYTDEGYLEVELEKEHIKRVRTEIPWREMKNDELYRKFWKE